ncbi:KH domain-containing protein [bacterium]|jgi:spoIIIJ-associated protein|nr:KH domain-containing protein [bacterium]MBT3795082.1 KH domain-containing protein [bacterium]MBT4633891.1 KH domain-containing protein [bacterium]
MSIQREYEGKTVTDATIEACKDLGINREELEFEVVSEGSRGLLGIGGRNAVIKVINESPKGEPEAVKDLTNQEPIDTVKVQEIFNEIVNQFVDDSKIEIETNDRNILLKLKSESNLGFLIGKKGEMIKNIEFLLSRIVSKQNSESVFVSIDINSFREKKDKELVERVGVLIDKVVSINRPLSLNPMNSYERRICYLEIEKNSEVTYKTKEVGMLKKITILPKVIDKNLS